jgi:hypothetical protein
MMGIDTNSEDMAMSDDKKTPSQAGNEQSAAHPATSGVYTNFAHAPADSNVNPPGKAQNGHGSATFPVAGGTQGGFEASQRAAESEQSGTPGSTAGNAGSTAGDADTADRGASRREG